MCIFSFYIIMYYYILYLVNRLEAAWKGHERERYKYNHDWMNECLMILQPIWIWCFCLKANIKSDIANALYFLFILFPALLHPKVEVEGSLHKRKLYIKTVKAIIKIAVLLCVILKAMKKYCTHLKNDSAFQWFMASSKNFLLSDSWVFI